MELDNKETNCIINVALGHWYPKGQKRLEKSLNYHGFDGDLIYWTDRFPNDNFDQNCPYNVKPSSFEEVIKRGYKKILWLDCSVWALRCPNEIFNMINDEGVLMMTSGFNAAQTCSDACLDYFKVTRDEAELMPDASTNCFGVNLEHPIGKEFMDRWIQSARDGAFHGSREHDNQSEDKRFKFHRQDQSCASIICGQMGIKMHNYGEYAMYYQPKMDDKIIFTLKGL